MELFIEFINSFGKTFVSSMGSMWVQSSVLIGILLTLDVLVRKHIRAAFRYCLWMLVLAKLVLPAGLSMPFSMRYWLGDTFDRVRNPARVVAKGPSAPMNTAGAWSPGSDIALGDNLIEQVDFSDTLTRQAPLWQADPAEKTTASDTVRVSPIESDHRQSGALTWQAVAFCLWLAACVGAGSLLVQKTLLVRGLVRQALPANERLMTLFASCRERMAVRGNVELRVSSIIPAPAVCGLFRPTVLIPERMLRHDFGEEELEAVFIHELTHIQRSDLWVRLLQTVLQVVYFYNPLLWVANATIRKVRELAVDEAVLAVLDEPTSRIYPRTLLKVAGWVLDQPTYGLQLIGVVESNNLLRERITTMLCRPIPGSKKLGITSLASLFLLGVLLLPMARAGNSKDRSSTTALVAGAPGTKVLHFPSDRVIGRVEVISSQPQTSKSRRQKTTITPLDSVLQARGDVVVPADREIRLRVHLRSGPDDLSCLAKLGPDDLHTLCLQSREPARQANQIRLEAISHLTGLQSLGLFSTRITARQLASIRSLSSLRELTLANELALPSDAFALLKNFPALEDLKLSWVRITDADIEHIAHLSKLRRLELWHEGIRGPGLAHLAKLPHLERLKLWGGGNVTYRHVRELQGLKGLKYLELWDADIGDDSLAFIGKLTALEEFTITKSWTGTSPNFTDAGMAHLKNLKNLRKIYIVDLEIGHVGAGHLAALPRLESLADIAITGDGLKSLASCQSLKRLVFGRSVDVADLVAIRSLEDVELHRAQALSDEDLSRLASLSHLKNLRVGTADITEKGWASLAKLKSLEHLTLACGGETRPVTKSGLNRLNELVNLVDLDISASHEETPVTEDALLNLTALKELKSVKLKGIPLQEGELAFLADLDDLEAFYVRSASEFSENVLRYVREMDKLEDLSISYNLNCTQDGLTQLSGLRRLGNLRLQGHITDSALQHLPALPFLFGLTVTTDVGFQPETMDRIKRLHPGVGNPIFDQWGKPQDFIIVAAPEPEQQSRQRRPDTRTGTRRRK